MCLENIISTNKIPHITKNQEKIDQMFDFELYYKLDLEWSLKNRRKDKKQPNKQPKVVSVMILNLGR